VVQALAAGGKELRVRRLVVEWLKQLEQHAAQGAERDPQRERRALAVHNLMTVGAMQAIAEAGLRVPEDIAVVGFDDANWATALRPPLTVVQQPTYDIGRIAAELLLRRIDGESFPPKRVVLRTELIERGSSRRRSQP
jgi:LacI family transcriptional regulator